MPLGSRIPLVFTRRSSLAGCWLVANCQLLFAQTGAGDGNRTRGLHFKGSAPLRPHAPLAHSGARCAFHPCPTHGIIAAFQTLERETGIEPATNSLEGCDSTTELLPRRPFKGSATLRCCALMLLSRYSGARFAFHPPYNVSRSPRCRGLLAAFGSDLFGSPVQRRTRCKKSQQDPNQAAHADPIPRHPDSGIRHRHPGKDSKNGVNRHCYPEFLVLIHQTCTPPAPAPWRFPQPAEPRD